MLDEERFTDRRAPLRPVGYMREREWSSVSGTMQDMASGLWFAPQPAPSPAMFADPDADTQVLFNGGPGAEPPQGADEWGAAGPTVAAGAHGLEAGVLAGLATALAADGMPAGAVAGHLADLAELRYWLNGPLWQMTVEHADAYFGRQIAWHEYPALLRQAQALTRYFAFLAGPDGVLVRERAHTPVCCPLDAWNWPTPAHQIRDHDTDPHQWAGLTARAMDPAD
jgi:hypothetical protein